MIGADEGFVKEVIQAKLFGREARGDAVLTPLLSTSFAHSGIHKPPQKPRSALPSGHVGKA